MKIYSGEFLDLSNEDCCLESEWITSLEYFILNCSKNNISAFCTKWQLEFKICFVITFEILGTFGNIGST